MKRKKPGQDCVPLQVVRNLTNQVPDIWDRVERIRDDKKRAGLSGATFQ